MDISRHSEYIDDTGHRNQNFFPVSTSRVHSVSRENDADNCCSLLALCFCCGALATTTYNSPRAGLRFISAAIAIVATIVIISCLASLAMSATGETLLSLLLIGIVVAALAALVSQPRETGLDNVYYSQGRI